MSNRIEILLKAYVELTVLWGQGKAGENSSRLWKSIEWLERAIKKELEK